MLNQNSEKEFLFSRQGNDILLGNQGDDGLFGYQGNDVLWGKGGNDFLSGGDGSDTLYGNRGKDILSGDGGNDVLFGEVGKDTFVLSNLNNEFYLGNDFAIIKDFNRSLGDTIKLKWHLDSQDYQIIYKPSPGVGDVDSHVYKGNDLMATVENVAINASDFLIV